MAAALAILMSEGLDANQLNMLGNFLMGLAQNIMIIQAVVASQPTDGPPGTQSTPDAPPTLAKLEQEINILKTKMAALEG